MDDDSLDILLSTMTVGAVVVADEGFASEGKPRPSHSSAVEHEGRGTVGEQHLEGCPGWLPSSSR